MQAQNLVASAGTLHTDARSVRLNVSGQFDNVKAVQALRLTVGGRIIAWGTSPASPAAIRIRPPW